MRALAAIVLALAVSRSAPASAQEDALLVILPEGTRGALVDALRVELRGRGVEAVLVLSGSTPAADEDALVLARAHGAGGVLWLALNENPLEPPDARYLRVPAASRSLIAHLPAAADAIEPRLFALSLAELLDAPPELAAPPVEAEPAPQLVPEPPHEDREASAESAAEPSAQAASPPEEPPHIFHPVLFARLALGAGAVEGAEPFFVGGALDFGVELTPWLVFVGDVTGWYAPGPDAGGAWAGMGFGGLARGLPGALTIAAEGGVAVAGLLLGVGGGVVARWEWPIEEVLRLGPRVAFHAWAPVISAGPQPPVGWDLFVGVDLLGFDLRIR